MEKTTMSIRIRLSIMMFLQYLMFAVWWVQLAGYLGKAEVSATCSPPNCSALDPQAPRSQDILDTRW